MLSFCLNCLVHCCPEVYLCLATTDTAQTQSRLRCSKVHRLLAPIFLAYRMYVIHTLFENYLFSYETHEAFTILRANHLWAGKMTQWRELFSQKCEKLSLSPQNSEKSWAYCHTLVVTVLLWWEERRRIPEARKISTLGGIHDSKQQNDLKASNMGGKDQHLKLLSDLHMGARTCMPTLSHTYHMHRNID